MSLIYIGMDTDKVERDFTRAYMEKLSDRITELEKEIETDNVNLSRQFDLLQEAGLRVMQLEQAIMSNCYDDFSTSGKRLMALVWKEKCDEY